VWGIVAVLLVASNPTEDVRRDYFNLRPEKRAAAHYLLLPKSELNWEAAISLVIPSTSRALVLNRHLPIRVSDRVYRIDLDELQWKRADLDLVLKNYPYERTKGSVSSILTRADWLCTEISDSGESDAYNILLFSGKGVPKTIQEWYKGLGVDQTRARQLQLEFGLVETKSGVARHDQRLMEFVPDLGGWDTATWDVNSLVNKSPLEYPNPEEFKKVADASEFIYGVPKLWYKVVNGKRVGGRGALSVFTLANAAGAIQKVAPTAIVVDKTLQRKNPEIRYPISCWSCHRTGLNAASTNGIKDLLDSGVRLDTKKPGEAELIDRYHLASGEDEYIAAANKKYAGAVLAATGLPPSEAIGVVIDCVNEYDAELTPAKAAEELGVTESDLKAAIVAQRNPDANLAGLVAGRNIPREVFEGEYLEALSFVRQLKK
jgi:hypothetical protein